MEQHLLAVALVILSLVTTEVSPLQCYQCVINPPPGRLYNTTRRLCAHFDRSDKFVVDCPYSTMCMKQEFYLDIQHGVRIQNVLRDCASQKHEYQDYKNGKWSPKMEVLEPYSEGCQDLDDKGERATKNRALLPPNPNQYNLNSLIRPVQLHLHYAFDLFGFLHRVGRYCYCRTDLCNSAPTTHEGYTDIMGVIVVFNLMKYINSLR